MVENYHPGHKDSCLLDSQIVGDKERVVGRRVLGDREMIAGNRVMVVGEV